MLDRLRRGFINIVEGHDLFSAVFLGALWMIAFLLMCASILLFAISVISTNGWTLLVLPVVMLGILWWKGGQQ